MSGAKSYNALLFILPALIWGSTWYVIKFQLGSVNPLWSVSYRFLLGGLLLLGYALIKGVNLSFSGKEHARMALQGIFLFGLNYWLVYVAEEELTSALVAIAFSTIIFFNILFGTWFLKNKTTKKVFIGAALGLTGTVLLFYQDLSSIRYESWPIFSTMVCMLSVVFASLGNITSAANQRAGIPVVQANGFGMVYGSIGMATIALFSGIAPTMEWNETYIYSLLYLSLFGSITAFGAYLTLVGKIGPDKAAYVLIVIPVIALVISVFLEDYEFNLVALGGILMILFGNGIVLRK